MFIDLANHRKGASESLNPTGEVALDFVFVASKE